MKSFFVKKRGNKPDEIQFTKNAQCAIIKNVYGF